MFACLTVHKPSLKRQNMKTEMWVCLLYDPANPLLDVHLQKTLIWQDTCTSVFTTALFTLGETWKQPKCPSIDEWIRKMWYIHTMEFSVQFSRSVVSGSLQPHESQQARPPCPSQTPRVYSNSCPSSQWCHPAISSSVVPFSSCPLSLPTQGLFQWVNSSHQVAKVLELQLQHQSFQWTPRTDLL